MKVVAFIFSFYILLLAVFPCCIVDDCPDDKTELVADHSAGDEDCGTCSPFFSCEGCSFATTTPDAGAFSVSSLPVQKIFSLYYPAALPPGVSAHWRPPQLS
ncbi:MAG TPA: hypothetical protein PKC69_00995 [Chitinophagaceae bacterium]|nr:hypothetical protein [Chitinophagaceae bacterium]